MLPFLVEIEQILQSSIASQAILLHLQGARGKQGGRHQREAGMMRAKRSPIRRRKAG